MTSLQLPESTSTVEVAVIDTTARLKNVPTSHFWGPTVEGFEKWSCCAFAFLVTHTDKTTGKQRRIVFDLGLPKDWENDFPPFVVEAVKKDMQADFDITKYVSEILEENGVPLDSLEAVVWSHPHFDHVGRVSLFPPSVDLITGPGVKAEHYPGYPTVKTSPILEREFANRAVTELDFDTSSSTSPLTTIGGFKAIDYFNDGSFYFLSAPGHATGHINALARTTPSSSNDGTPQKSTFILMGADSYHHCTQLRPSKHVPLPDTIPGPIPQFEQYVNACPGHIFDVVHPSSTHRKQQKGSDGIPAHYTEDMVTNHDDPKTTPYMTVSSTPEGKSLAIDLAAAKGVIKGLQKFDGDEDVLLIAAHDASLLDVVEYFPKSANGWKTKGWKEKGRWLFLGDLKEAIEISNK